MMSEFREEILHIFVVGFHHKKGCQLEYSYPELDKLPESWKNLTSLAMPDGAHNYDSDTVFFHLPSLDVPPRTLFGVSCFQQVAIEKVKNRTSDMTRGAVQKSVCILSTVPLYGYLQVKIELVTAAFFDKGDFSQVSILRDAFHHLNDCLPGSVGQHLYDGLSVRDLIARFRHRSLLLFKLMLLDRKVVYFHCPVAVLVHTVISLMSLHPNLVSEGLYSSACVSCQPHEDEPEGRKKSTEVSQTVEDGGGDVAVEEKVRSNGPDCDKLNEGKEKTTEGEVQSKELQCNNGTSDAVITVGSVDGVNITERQDSVCEGIDSLLIEDYFADEESSRIGSRRLRRQSSNETIRSDCLGLASFVSQLPSVDLAGCGLPLPIFSDGNLCLPYLSISYLDYITSPRVRGFHIGATNVLFKQKRQLTDVLVEMETGRIETQNAELRRQLALSTEDLRFAEHVVRGVVEPRDAEEGTERWVRDQFTYYTLALLRTSLLPEGSKELDHFNPQFMAAWQNTLNYNMWLAKDHSAIQDISPGHPCAGTLSVADMRIRLSQVMSSDSGRKLNQAVATTGKAVGGAISHARGALSSWWSNMTTPEAKASKVDTI